jgi:hypothetical protein
MYKIISTFNEEIERTRTFFSTISKSIKALNLTSVDSKPITKQQYFKYDEKHSLVRTIDVQLNQQTGTITASEPEVTTSSKEVEDDFVEISIDKPKESTAPAFSLSLELKGYSIKGKSAEKLFPTILLTIYEPVLGLHSELITDRATKIVDCDHIALNFAKERSSEISKVTDYFMGIENQKRAMTVAIINSQDYAMNLSLLESLNRDLGKLNLPI